MRALSDCPIPGEAQQLQGLLNKILELRLTDIDGAMQTAGNGIAAVIMADTYCAKHVTRRPVVRFKDDEELTAIHEEYGQEVEKLSNLQKELAESAQKVQTLLKSRWDKSLIKFGLATERFSYEVNEKDGTIYLVDLKCLECKGRTLTRKARQEVAAQLVTYEREAKEPKNDRDGAPTNDDSGEPPSPGEDGEASSQE
jgi:hypothetical protein